MFDKGYKFKQDSTTLLKDFDIKNVLTPAKNSQTNVLVERLHQVILNMLVTKDIDNRVFDYIDQWDENLATISCSIRASYHRTVMVTPGQAFFGIDMLFNLASVVDWWVATAANRFQVDIDNVRETPSESRMTAQ